MPYGIVSVICPASGPLDPDKAARFFFNGDIPGAYAHQRYIATRGPAGTSLETPEVLSLYHVTDTAAIASLVKAKPLPDNVITIRVFERLKSWGQADDLPIPHQVTAAVSLTPPSSLIKECDAWYNDEHVPLLSKVPGWKSSLRYKLLAGDGPEYLAFHNYVLDSPNANLSSMPEFKTAISTPASAKIVGACKENTVNGYERREWDYQYTIPICPPEMEEKVRNFVLDFYKISDLPGAHDQYVEKLTDDASVAFNGKVTKGRECIIKLRHQMWTAIIKRHHRADLVFRASHDEVAIYGSSYFTHADGEQRPNQFWARMKFEDSTADKLKLVFYEVNKREPLVDSGIH